MNICKLKIVKFRGVEECVLDIGKVNALVGENNAGKSSLLKAINAFFNPDDELLTFRKGQHQYSSNSYPKITVVFENIPAVPDLTSKVFDNTLTIELTYSPKTKNITYKYIKEEAHSLDMSFINDVLKQYVDFVLIPPIRNENDFLINEQAVLKRVIDRYLNKHFQSRDTVSPKFKEATNQLKKNAFNKISKELGRFYGSDHDLKFHLDYKKDITYRDFLDFTFLQIIDQDNHFNIEDNGSGIQSLTIIALYRLLASLLEKNILLGIEEPEINLHPQAQRKLVKIMLASLNANNEVQIFFTTHSTVIVDSIDHTDILLFRRIEDKKRGFKTTITQLPSDFMEKYDLSEEGYSKFHKYRNSDFFFSRFIVIVESSTDAEVFSALMRLKHIDMEDYSLSIINLDGIKNMKYPLFLIKELQLPYLIILDKDYFLPYLNTDLEPSRDSRGFPRYKFTSFNSGRYVESLIPDDEDRTKLLQLFKANHSRALDLLDKYNIISLRYCLEMDLISSGSACNIFYNKLNIPIVERSTKTLLVDKKKALKKMDNLMFVIENTPHQNLPNSYKRIKKVLIESIKKYC